MRLIVAGMVLMAAALASSQGYGQATSAGPSMSSPMNGDHGPPDAARVQQELATAKAAQTAGALKIIVGKNSAEWTAATLAPLEHKTLNVYNEHVKANQTYAGVPLIELLKKLGVPDKPRGKEFQLYVVAEGSDGYKVVYSLGEIAPDVHDGDVIVADTLDGKALTGSAPFQLVVSGEKTPARWVRNLVAIRVFAAE